MSVIETLAADNDADILELLALLDAEIPDVKIPEEGILDLIELEIQQEEIANLEQVAIELATEEIKQEIYTKQDAESPKPIVEELYQELAPEIEELAPEIGNEVAVPAAKPKRKYTRKTPTTAKQKVDVDSLMTKWVNGDAVREVMDVHLPVGLMLGEVSIEDSDIDAITALTNQKQQFGALNTLLWLTEQKSGITCYTQYALDALIDAGDAGLSRDQLKNVYAGKGTLGKATCECQSFHFWHLLPVLKACRVVGDRIYVNVDSTITEKYKRERI